MEAVLSVFLLIIGYTRIQPLKLYMGRYYLFANRGPILDIVLFSLGYHASIKPRTVYECMD